MRYTYTAYDGNDKRLHLTTRVEEIVPEYVTSPNYVLVEDNLKNTLYLTLRDQDDLDGHIEALQRAATWKPGVGEQVSKLPDANLKTAAAQGKPGISAVPPVAIMALGAAMQDGVNKYEKYNWREAGATVSVFYDAMARHMLAYYVGENYASDSKIHHLAHLMAGCAILLDAELHGKLNDDRLAKNIEPEVIKQLMKLIKKD